MSGTSLDGLDACLLEFSYENSKWTFNILEAETLKYSRTTLEQLKTAHLLSSPDLLALHIKYGKHLGELAKEWLSEQNHQAELIASHGHTIFHQAKNSLTFQLGHGGAIAKAAGLKVVADFRSEDISVGGQGAPLVPIGDQLLFPENKAFLNIGGISNISFYQNDHIHAFDIAPANQVLNFLSNQLGFEYDKGGKLAASGNFNEKLYRLLNQMEFYKLKGPKTLGREWVEDHVFPVLKASSLKLEDQLNTYTKHLAFQIVESIPNEMLKEEVILSGGGSKNDFLVEELKALSLKTQIPSEEIIDFKEALIFAFLGLLRIRNETNVLKQVTGAIRNTCSGAIFSA